MNANKPAAGLLPDRAIPAFGLEVGVGVEVPVPVPVPVPVGAAVDEDEDVDFGEAGAVPLGDITLSRTWIRPLFVLHLGQHFFQGTMKAREKGSAYITFGLTTFASLK